MSLDLIMSSYIESHSLVVETLRLHLGITNKGPHEVSTPTPERKKTTKPNLTVLDELYGTLFQYHQFKCYNFYLVGYCT